jgi:hypothetical protein
MTDYIVRCFEETKTDFVLKEVEAQNEFEAAEKVCGIRLTPAASGRPNLAQMCEQFAR